MSSGISTTIGLNISGFLGPLATLSGELQRFQGLFSALQTGFLGLIAVGESVGDVLAAPFELAGDAIEKAANMQSLETAFGTLVGDMQSGLALVGELQALGASTPFEVLEDLAPAGKSLLAFGESAATIPNTLRMIGDVASGVGAGINELATIYGKARTAGTLYTEDINELVGRGIPVISAFAQQLGVAESKVKEMASNGQITFANLERAFVSMTSEGGQFAGMMEAQSKTWNGLKSNFADTWSQIQVAFGKPLVEGLSEPFAEVIGDLGGMQEAAADLGRSLGELIGDGIELAQTFGSIVSATADFVRPLLPAIAAVALGFLTLKVAGSSTVTTLKNHVTALAVAIRNPGVAVQGLRIQWQGAMAGMTAATQGAAAAMRTALLSTGIGALLAIGTYVFSSFMEKANALDSAADSMQDIGAEFEKQFKGNAKDMAGVSSETERLELLEKLNAQLDQMREKQANVERDFKHLGDNDTGAKARADIRDILDQQAQTLEVQINRTRALTAHDLQRAKAANAIAKATAEQAKALDDLAEASKKLSDAKDKDAWDKLTPEQQRAQIVQEARVYNPGQIDGEIRKLEEKRKGNRLTDPAEIDRLARLFALREKLIDVEKRAAQEKERADEKARQDAEKIAEQNKRASEFEREAAIELAKLRAKGRGDSAEVERLEQQQRYDDLFKQAQGQGLGAMQADSYAREMLDAEAQAKAAEEKKNPNSRTYADADRRVGLGGAAGGGDLLLSESRKQTRELQSQTSVLQRVEQHLQKQANQRPAPGVAVFARG